MHLGHAVRLSSTVVCALAVSLIATAPSQATAGGATETLRPAVDRVLSILADPALKGAEHRPERRRALRAVINGVIDFPDAARRALAVHWQGRTDGERAEFVALFEELVTYSYVARMEAYAGQTVAFVSETAGDGTATVLTQMQNRQGAPVPIDYRMHQRNGRWLVYDVIVEGVSLVGNYRTQFNSVILTSSYAELVRRMRTRVGELEAGTGPVAFSREPAARAFPGGLP
jgi:phospholipid transport system substrate-binding protein